MKKIFSILVVATLLMVGCENSEDIPVVEDGVMQIEVLHPSATRMAIEPSVVVSSGVSRQQPPKFMGEKPELNF